MDDFDISEEYLDELYEELAEIENEEEDEEYG